MRYLLLLFIIPLVSVAQDQPQADGEESRKPPFRVDKFKDREVRMERLKAILKEKHPERFAELEKLKQESPEKFRQEMRRIMLEMPEKFGKFKGGHASKYDKPGADRLWLREMSDKNPEKFKELMSLRQGNPQKFREEMAKEFLNRMKKRPMFYKEHMQAIKTATQNFHNASDDQKEAAKADLRKILQESFEKDLNHRREMAERLEKHLSTIKKQIAQREKNSESVVDERLEMLLKKTSKTH